MTEQSRKWTRHHVQAVREEDCDPEWCVMDGDFYLASVYTPVMVQGSAGTNAQLFADALNTANATGLTPRQLAERVVELEGLLRRIVTEDDNCELDQTTIEIARAALRTINIS